MLALLLIFLLERENLNSIGDAKYFPITYLCISTICIGLLSMYLIKEKSFTFPLMLQGLKRVFLCKPVDESIEEEDDSGGIFVGPTNLGGVYVGPTDTERDYNDPNTTEGVYTVETDTRAVNTGPKNTGVYTIETDIGEVYTDPTDVDGIYTVATDFGGVFTGPIDTFEANNGSLSIVKDCSNIGGINSGQLDQGEVYTGPKVPERVNNYLKDTGEVYINTTDVEVHTFPTDTKEVYNLETDLGGVYIGPTDICEGIHIASTVLEGGISYQTYTGVEYNGLTHAEEVCSVSGTVGPTDTKQYSCTTGMKGHYNTPIDLPENSGLTDLKEVYTIPTDITGMYTALSDIEVHPGSEDLIMEKMSDCSTDREDIFIFTYLQNIGVNVGQRNFKKVFSIPTDTGEFYRCPTDVEEVVDCPVTQRVKSVAYGKVEQSVRLIQVQEAAKPEQENEKRKRRKRKLKDKKRY